MCADCRIAGLLEQYAEETARKRIDRRMMLMVWRLCREKKR
jgi:hypothetical protein